MMCRRNAVFCVVRVGVLQMHCVALCHVFHCIVMTLLSRCVCDAWFVLVWVLVLPLYGAAFALFCFVYIIIMLDP